MCREPEIEPERTEVTHVPVWLGNGDTVCAEWDGLDGVGSSKLLCRCRRFGAGRLVIWRLFQCGVLGAGGWETGVLDAANTPNARADWAACVHPKSISRDSARP